MNKYINYLTYNGKSLRDFNAYINGAGTFDAPERSVEYVVIPGRNGTLTIDNQRYENITVTYDSFIFRDFHENVVALRNYLMQWPGYNRLEDTYNPEEYRLARYVSGLSVSPTAMLKEGSFTLAFDCMPQRFLKVGEIVTEFTSNGNIFNPTLQTAKPLLRVYGNGQLGIGDNTLTITGTTGYTDIDCESLDAYADGENRNSNISGTFPVLLPGTNGIALSGITKVQITPRWWIL